MKRTLVLLLFAALLFSLAACGTASDTGDVSTQAPISDMEEAPGSTEEPASAPDTETETGSNILIAFFSRADENYNVGYIEKGNTQILAEMIAQETGGTLFHIERDTPYPTGYDACTDEAKAEQNDNARPALKEDIDIAGYDTIYLGYPIWWGDMPMAVYTFLGGHDFAGKTIVPFCTHAGSGVSGTDQSIAEICPDATVLTALPMLGSTLPRNDKSITTEAGDLILYQGSRFVIYYDTNSWDFTRLGTIDGVTAQELREILGEGDVTATLSIIHASGDET